MRNFHAPSNIIITQEKICLGQSVYYFTAISRPFFLACRHQRKERESFLFDFSLLSFNVPHMKGHTWKAYTCVTKKYQMWPHKRFLLWFHSVAKQVWKCNIQRGDMTWHCQAFHLKHFKVISNYCSRCIHKKTTETTGRPKYGFSNSFANYSVKKVNFLSLMWSLYFYIW